MSRRDTLIFLLAFSIVSQLHASPWFTEYWQRLNWTMWSQDPYSLTTFCDMRTGNHWSNNHYFQLTEQFAYKASEAVTLEAHYSYIHARSVVPDSDWHWRHRLEFEANRIFKLYCDNELRTRNRFEVERVQGNAKTQFRLRQRTLFYHPVENNGCLTAFSFYNEVFYNCVLGRFIQERICPLQLTFELNKTMSIDVFTLARFFLHSERWYKSWVVGSQLNF